MRAPIPDTAIARIVLVEDNAADIYLFRQALQRAKLAHELTVFQNGEQALAFALGDPGTVSGVPDLLVLDLNLPRIGGCEVLQAVRRNPKLSKLPVVVMTSSAASQDYERCVQLGVSRYIIKPLELEEFLCVGEVVKTVFVESRTSAAGH